MEYFIFLLPILGIEYNKEANSIVELNSISPAYHKVIEQNVKYNDKSAMLTRFQRGNKKIQHQKEHITFITRGETLLGFAKFSTKDEVSETALPTKKESEDIALSFLKKAAPELLDNMTVLWIKPHSESIEKAGKSIKLTGMKVKCRDLHSGLYFWVIIGANKNVMTFERDIKWITFPGKRGTEKWLDDSWIQKNYPF